VTATNARRERLYREYATFFEVSERRRRWDVFTDVPWEKLEAGRTDPELAYGAETFCGVEMYLPDYVSQGLNLVRDSFGQAWFQANWAYEESKHSLVLREYLLRSGQRSAEQFDAFEQQIRSKRWKMPFQSARQMTCYGSIQEAATQLLYQKHLDLAKQRGDTVLAAIYSFVARDEAAHAAFYRKVLSVELEDDRAGTLRDLSFVFANFRMPGVGLVPDYDTRIGFMRSAGVERATFLDLWFRLLRQLGTSRRELAAAAPAATRPA